MERFDLEWRGDINVVEDLNTSTCPPKQYPREQRWLGATEEGWKQTYKAAAQEAAQCGRLTRLKEHSIATTAVGRGPANDATKSSDDNDVWKPKDVRTIHDNLRTAALRIIQEAARKGAATKLPEWIITTNSCSNNDEDDTVDSVKRSEDALSKLEHAILDLNQRERRLEVWQNGPYDWSAHVLPPLPPVIKHRRQSKQLEIPIRPMVDLSALAALKALERQARLSRPQSHLRIRPRCQCQWCQTVSPYQTHALREQSLMLLPKPSPPPVDDAPCKQTAAQPTTALRREVPRILRLVDIAHNNKRVSGITLPAELQGATDDFDSSEFTEVTVSTTEEGDDAVNAYPFITVRANEEDEHSQTSDLTNDRTTLYVSAPPRTTTDTTLETPTQNPASISDSRSKNSSNERMDRAPANDAAKSAARATATAATGRPPLSRRHHAAPQRMIRRPNLEYVNVVNDADVSMLSLPVYFEDAVEQAILEQILQTNNPTAAPVDISTSKSTCRIRTFLKRRFQTRPLHV